jgi:nucleoredoxin
LSSITGFITPDVADLWDPKQGFWRMSCSLKCVRYWVYVCFGLMTAVTQAGQLPLTVSEISLMLRTGYSSKSLIHELSERHFAGTLDDANETALLNAGASPQLIAVLKNGAYSLSVDKTAAVLQQMQSERERRAERAEASEKAQARYDAEIVRQRTAKTSSMLETTRSDAISQFLKTDLVQIRNGELAPVEETALANKKLIAVYFSAEWCGPCRKFTPQLVDYYKRVAPEHPEFEIVFYSMDRSADSMTKYMRDERMPWLAIDFAKLKDKQALKRDAGNGIPSLVLMDSSGSVISSSFAGSQYRGPQQVLADLDAIFAGKPPARLAVAQ